VQDRVAEQAFYDRLFRQDTATEHISGGYDEIHLLAWPEPPAGRVLDLGCGTGAHALRLARRGVDVVAVDLTIRGIRATKARLERERLRALYVVADAEHLPFRDEAVDVVWTALLLHHFPSLDMVPLELARVTRQRIIAFEPNANNALTWLASNVLNRWWGLSAMSPNQRALWPHHVRRIFARHGFRQRALHYVDRTWSDRHGGIRRAYRALAGWLPERFRANKFLVTFDKERA
jgi:ubiquinone/menaquinone biosynthesis C-methylase UbiE